MVLYRDPLSFVLMFFVPPHNVIVSWNPAKIIKYRFSQQTIDRLIQSAWWEKDIEKLKANQSDFKKILSSVETAQEKRKGRSTPQ